MQQCCAPSLSRWNIIDRHPATRARQSRATLTGYGRLALCDLDWSGMRQSSSLGYCAARTRQGGSCRNPTRPGPAGFSRGPCHLHAGSILHPGITPPLFLGSRAGGLSTAPAEIQMLPDVGELLLGSEHWEGRLVTLQQDSTSDSVTATAARLPFRVRVDIGSVGFSRGYRLRVPANDQIRVAGRSPSGKWGEVLSYEPIFVGRGRYFEIWSERLWKAMARAVTAERTIEIDNRAGGRPTRSVAHVEGYHCFFEIAPRQRWPQRSSLTIEDMEPTEHRVIDALRRIEPLISDMWQEVESFESSRGELRELRLAVNEIQTELLADPPRRRALVRLLTWLAHHIALVLTLNLVAAAVWDEYGHRISEILRAIGD